MKHAGRSSIAMCALLSVLLGGEAVAEPRTRVVVELFTSQGCPACPPAEDFMRDLAVRDDVIALEYHIDYFDYAGWVDPFGSTEFTRRWQDYAKSLGARYEYTPFMVVGGRTHQIGSRRDIAEERIRQMLDDPPDGPSIDLRLADESVFIGVGEGAADGSYDVFLATYDNVAETVITGGENRGRTAVNTHVVREFERVGSWSGEPVETAAACGAAIRGDGGCAVLLQRAGGGPIIAAAELEFERPAGGDGSSRP